MLFALIATAWLTVAALCWAVQLALFGSNTASMSFGRRARAAEDQRLPRAGLQLRS